MPESSGRFVIEAVLDTNVLVAGLRSRRGASFRVLHSLGATGWRPSVSVPLALEYEEVLKRPGLVPTLTDTDVDDFLDYFFQAAARVESVPRTALILRDADDQAILELAAFCKAVIVTHNISDFSGAEGMGIVVVTPAAFVAMLEDRI